VGLVAFAAVALTAVPAFAGTISVAWDPITHPDLVGYRVFYSTTSGNFGQWTDVGLVTQTTLNGLTDCTTYYIAVKARSSDGSLSANYSNQISGWSRPTVTTATPASIARAGQASVTIAGTNFMPGAAVTLSNSAIVVNSVTVSGCNQLVASLTVPATATLGAVNVTVANPDQVYGTGTGTLTVANAAPNGVVSAPSSSTVTIDEGQTVTFGGTATDPDSSLPLTYRWDFGDPAIADSTVEDPGAVRFDNPGTYTVSFTVTDSLGLADPTPATLTVNVNAAQAPVVTNINASPVGATTATITWTTNTQSNSMVLYRRVGDTVYQQTPVNATMVTSHSVQVLGLSPSTQYEYSVRSTDANNLTTTAPATTGFTTQSSANTYLRIEAEDGPIGSPAQTQNDTSAFAGVYVRLAAGTPSGTAANPAGSWNYGFYVPSPATWYVWYRLYAPNSTSASWFERVDGGNYAEIAPSTTGAWVWVEGRSYGLGAGQHTLTLGGGEAQARIDRILITQDAAFQPTEAPGGDNVPPGAATALVAAADDQQVSLSWTNPTDSGALRVVVRFSTGASAPLTPADGQPLIDRAATSGASDGVLHTGLTNGTTYRYSVFIIDASGNVSNPVSGSATPVPPVIPLGTVQNVRRTDKLP
jgi:chitodextrinase